MNGISFINSRPDRGISGDAVRQKGEWSAYQLIWCQVSQSLVDEGGLLVADHLLAATVANHQLRPHRPLGALLQRHLQAEHGKIFLYIIKKKHTQADLWSCMEKEEIHH